MYERQPTWDHSIAQRETELEGYRRALSATTDQHRKAELERCIRTIEAMLPVYRQMERLFATIDDREDKDV